MALTLNTVNQIPKGTVLYVQGNAIESIGLLVKGRVLVYNVGTKILCGPGSFLGASDLIEGNYLANYYVAEDAQILPIPAKTAEDLENILENKSEYRGTVIPAMSRQIVELYKIYNALVKEVATLKAFMENSYKSYQEIGKKSSLNCVKIPSIAEMPELEIEGDVENAMYYVEAATLPVDVQKKYYGHGSQIAIHHAEEQMQLVGDIHEQCDALVNYIQNLFVGILHSEDACLYTAVAQMALDLRKLKGDTKPIMKLFSEITEKIKEIETFFQGKTGKKLAIDKDKMEQVHQMMLSAGDIEEDEEDGVSAETAIRYAGTDTEAIEKELTGSLSKLLAYSKLPQEKCDSFQQNILKFMSMKDKADAGDDARKLRKNIANGFYEIYEAIFIRDYEEKTGDRLIDLFLLYGFVDERLLNKEQLIELYCLDDKNDESGPCKVYNIKQWLTAIYEGKKEPSKSEFDMDYNETLRDMKKNGQIREEEMKAAQTDVKRKLSYEIANMFRYNSRIVSGQISIFVPILYKDLFMGHLDQSLMTTNRVNDVIKKIVSVDYSLFYRESMYSAPEKGIDKEYIQQEMYPDIILMSVYGSNGAMWQEIEGRKRTSHARFLFPIFAETDMEDNFIRVCGRFRWEICRTIQGAAWNDVKVKSLTSEYVDYIQFYKKNRALSEEKKEKLKMQIQKGRGNTREVFVIDYLLWIKNESTGSLRMNKVAREVMATYCPFAKELREKVQTQPLFEEAMAKFNRERLKKIKDLDLRYRTYETKKIEITEELQKTMEFYRDL